MPSKVHMIFAIYVIFVFTANLVSPVISSSSNQGIVFKESSKNLRLPQHLALESILPPIKYNESHVNYLLLSIDENTDTVWLMQGHDAAHTGRSFNGTECNYAQDLWRYETSSVLYGSPVIDSEGTVYFGSFSLQAFNPNGTLKWAHPGNMETAPAIDDNGIIYYGTSRGVDDRFYAIYPNGTLKWFIPTAKIMASPVISPDGTIIFPNSHANTLIAIHPNGTKKWEFLTNHVIYSTPAVGSDGTVYVGSHDCYVYAVNPNGTLKWSFLTGAWVHGSPSIGSDGTIYCGSDDGYLYALYPNNGSMKWQLAIGASYASPTIGLDGTLYLGVWEKRFYAINPDGTIKWSFDTSPGKVWGSTAALSADGTMYFATADLEWSGGVELIALWTNGIVKWRRPFSSTFSSPAIGRDGTLYIGNNKEHDVGQLRALGYGSLQADANGPYEGDDQMPINFTGSIIGGLPPYTFNWDFGDGGTSSEQNPSYRYTAIGTYTATFIIRDSEGNESSDTANVTITYALPSVTLVKPVLAIYIMNIKVLPLSPDHFIGPYIIGPIVVKVDAYQEPFGIDRVEFYINDQLRHVDKEAPYSWAWIIPTIRCVKLSVCAVDNSGNCSKFVETWPMKIF